MVFLVISFILSRLYFLNAQPLFFDSQEYIDRFSNENVFDAIISGHVPLHAGYIVFGWPFYQIGSIINFGTELVIIAQIIFALIAHFCFYKIAKCLFDRKVALLSSLLLLFFPLYWITHVTVMMESVYLSSFVISFFFLLRYLKRSSRSEKDLFFMVLFFMFSFFTHTAIVLFVPLYLVATWVYRRSALTLVFLNILFGIVIVSFGQGIFHKYHVNNSNLVDGILYFYTSKIGESADLSLSFNSFLVFCRNAVIPLLRNNTIGVVLIALVGLTLMLLRKNWKLSFIFFAWLVPIFIVNQWWDSLFFGRHALIASFGIALLAGYFVSKSKLLIFMLFLYLSLSVLPAMLSLKKPVPYLQMQEVIHTLECDGLYIESHFARPQIQGEYCGEVFFVDEPGYDTSQLNEKINAYLVSGKAVFVSGHALSEPYGLFSGPFLHTLSLSYRNEFVLKSALDEFCFQEFTVVNRRQNLVVYKISTCDDGFYPYVRNLINSHRRIDYYDPVYALWNKIKSSI